MGVFEGMWLVLQSIFVWQSLAVLGPVLWVAAMCFVAEHYARRRAAIADSRVFYDWQVHGL